MVIPSPLSTIIILKYDPRFGPTHIFKEYELPLPVRNVKENKVLIRQQPMHLPHELFAFLSKYPVEFNERLLPGGLSAQRQYWQDCELCLEQHPAREKMASGDWVISPLRLYGDDAQYFKDRSCAVLTMSSILCRLPSCDSRLLLTVLPLYDIVPDVTMPHIYDVLALSFKVLLRGYWLATDPFGNPWPATSWRAGMAGTLLVPKRDGICIVQWPR